MSAPDPRASEQPAVKPSAGFFHVLGSFLGIRKRTSGERDTVTIKPVHVILAGLLGAALFVAILVGLVVFITRGR
jgi:hypothetical protein